MEYRIVTTIVDSEGNLFEEGEGVILELDDGSILSGQIGDIFSDGSFDIDCAYFSININIENITEITMG